MTKIIADISGNHGGSLNKALDLIRAAAHCGCDYAKFQYYRPRLMPDYAENGKIYDELRVWPDWVNDLFEQADISGIPLFASVFDVDGIADLERYHPSFYKIASPESTRLRNYDELIKHTRRESGLILSTGGKDYAVMKKLANDYHAILLWCPSGHPALPEQRPPSIGVNGLSDHCADLTNAKLALEYPNIEWIERHIKLDGDDDCIDAKYSSNPKEMAELCKLAKAS